MAIGGGTAAGAAVAARRLIDEGSKALVSFGLAGALDPALRSGAIIVPSAVIVDGVYHPTDPTLCHALGGSTAHVVLGADAIAASVEEKRCLHDKTEAAAVDLETGAVARAAVAHRLPFAVLRVVCDPANRALPSAALAALNTCGRIRLWRVAASLIGRPGQLPAMLALATDAVVARRSLRAHVTRIARPPASLSLSQR